MKLAGGGRPLVDGNQQPSYVTALSYSRAEPSLGSQQECRKGKGFGSDLKKKIRKGMFSGFGLTKLGGGEKRTWEGEWDCASVMSKEKSHPVRGGGAGVAQGSCSADCSGQFNSSLLSPLLLPVLPWLSVPILTSLLLLRACICQHLSAKSPGSLKWLRHGLDTAPFPAVGEPWCHDPAPCWP